MADEAVAALPPVWSRWMSGARPATLPAAISPVLVGTAAAASGDADFRPLVFAAALAAAILIQIGANLANDLFDFERGADDEGRLGPPRVTQSGLIPPSQVRAGTLVAFGGAAVIGLYLATVGGWPILAIGVACIVAGLAYTGGPWPLGYHGLGDLFVFVFFGLVAVCGSYYLQADEIDARALTASLPVALTVTAILVVNNLRDIETDRRAGKMTLAVLLGDHATRLEYASLVLGAYLALPLLPAASAPGGVLLPWLTLPLAAGLSRSVLAGADGRDLNPILKWTARLHLAFGVLLALGFLL